MKSMGYLAKLLIVIGVILCISGIIFGKVSNSYKGVELMGTGAIVDGELVISEQMSGYRLGEQKEAVERFQVLSVICYIFAVFSFIGAVVCSLQKSRVENTKKIVQVGRILEKNEHVVMVEFEDGFRRYFSVEPGVIVTNGDFGEMTFQGNFLVAFRKR